ncbi:MAG: hypothetical protein WD492_12920 [Alkalispirochaeta sp.]
MKLKVVSDGTPEGTQVMSAETGELIEGLTEVRFRVPADGLPIARITVERIEADVQGDEDVSE